MAKVKGDSYKIDPIPLTHVRPFVVGEIALAEVIAGRQGPSEAIEGHHDIAVASPSESAFETALDTSGKASTAEMLLDEGSVRIRRSPSTTFRCSFHDSSHDLPRQVRIWEEPGESHTFLGLATAYVLHLVDVYVRGLPSGPFSTSECRDGSGRLLRQRTDWEWQVIATDCH